MTILRDTIGSDQQDNTTWQSITYQPALWGSELCQTCKVNQLVYAKECKSCYSKSYYNKNKDIIKAKVKAYQRKKKTAKATATVVHIHFHFHTQNGG